MLKFSWKWEAMRDAGGESDREEPRGAGEEGARADSGLTHGRVQYVNGHDTVVRYW